MTMPKFEPVGYLDADGYYRYTNTSRRDIAPLYTADQLTEAYEAGKRDAIPEGWVLVPKQPTFPMLIALNEVAIEVAGLGHSDGPQKILTEGYAAMLAAAPKGEA